MKRLHVIKINLENELDACRKYGVSIESTNVVVESIICGGKSCLCVDFIVNE